MLKVSLIKSQPVLEAAQALLGEQCAKALQAKEKDIARAHK